jgi:dienelactone hydrolase
VQFRGETLSIPLPGGGALQATLRIPDGPDREAKPFPVVMIFGGFENAGRVLELVQPDRPAILASFDYPFTPPRKLEFPASLRYLPQAKRFIHETIEGIAALKSALKRRPDVDPGKFTLVGASFGAPFVTAAAASDPEFRGVALVHGFADVVGTSVHQLMRSFGKRFGALAYPMAWTLCQAGFLYIDGPEPEVEARKLSTGQSVLMISASEDSFIPRNSSELLWSALQASRARRERLEMPGDHLQPGSEALIAKIMGHVVEWMERMGLT